MDDEKKGRPTTAPTGGAKLNTAKSKKTTGPKTTARKSRLAGKKRISKSGKLTDWTYT